jgi:putative ABC transport system ATP-binding protein
MRHVREPEELVAVTVRNLHKYYTSGDETVHLLDGLNFSIGSGQFFAIAGVSGSGKTTLLNIISGLDVPSSGEVVVFGRTISAFDDEGRSAFRRDHLGFITAVALLLAVPLTAALAAFLNALASRAWLDQATYVSP